MCVPVGIGLVNTKSNGLLNQLSWGGAVLVVVEEASYGSSGRVEYDRGETRVLHGLARFTTGKSGIAVSSNLCRAPDNAEHGKEVLCRVPRN
jgi:hypothetical protein